MRHGRSPFAAIAISVQAALFIANLWLQSNVQGNVQLIINFSKTLLGRLPR